MNRLTVGMMLLTLAGVAVADEGAQKKAEASGDTAEKKAEASGTDAAKESQRAALRKLRMVVGDDKSAPNLDEVILDWTEAGFVRAAKVAAKADEKPAIKLGPLGALSQLEKLELSGLSSDLRILSKLRTLKSLTISECKKVAGAILGRLVGLEGLRLTRTPLLAPKALRALKALTELSLVSAGVRDVSFVAQLGKLTRLDLSSNPKLKSIKALRKLGELNYLDLSGTAVKDFSALKGLLKLKTLKVSKGANVAALDELKTRGLGIEEL